MSTDKKIGELLLYLRKENRYSQTDIGREVGMSASGYRDIEHGKISARLDVLAKLAKLYDISLPAVFESLERGEDLIPGPPEYVKIENNLYRLVSDQEEYREELKYGDHVEAKIEGSPSQWRLRRRS